MIDKFLNAKHWQIFILIFAIPMIFQIIFMGIMFSYMFSNSLADIKLLSIVLVVFPIILILMTSIYFLWFRSVGLGLNRILPTDLKQKEGKFKIALYIPLVYIIAILVFVMVFLTMLANIGSISIFALIVPIHLLAMVCIFYCMYFIAKAYKTAELKRTVTFSDFVGEFFMIWFLPIGIWFLQPKINKMIEEGYFSEEAEIV